MVQPGVQERGNWLCKRLRLTVRVAWHPDPIRSHPIPTIYNTPPSSAPCHLHSIFDVRACTSRASSAHFSPLAAWLVAYLYLGCCMPQTPSPSHRCWNRRRLEIVTVTGFMQIVVIFCVFYVDFSYTAPNNKWKYDSVQI